MTVWYCRWRSTHSHYLTLLTVYHLLLTCPLFLTINIVVRTYYYCAWPYYLALMVLFQYYLLVLTPWWWPVIYMTVWLLLFRREYGIIDDVCVTDDDIFYSDDLEEKRSETCYWQYYYGRQALQSRLLTCSAILQCCLFNMTRPIPVLGSEPYSEQHCSAVVHTVTVHVVPHPPFLWRPIGRYILD